MTKLEDRLRGELRAMAEQVQPQTLRPLRAPAARTGWSARFRWAADGRPSRKQRWLAAAAAVAAVAVIVAAVNIAGRLTQHQVAGPVAAMPRYYLNNAANGTVAIRRSATGQLVATVAPPAHLGYSWVAAAADDRRFVLAAVAGSWLARRDLVLSAAPGGGRPSGRADPALLHGARRVGRVLREQHRAEPGCQLARGGDRPGPRRRRRFFGVGSLAADGSLDGYRGSRAILDRAS